MSFSVALWLCGSVAPWLRGSVAPWQVFSVPQCLCGRALCVSRLPRDATGARRAEYDEAIGGGGSRWSLRPPSMQTVLIVEDEPQIAQILRDYLEHAGFDVAVAATGPAALDRAREHTPALLILDLGLPGMDGLEVARRVRRDTDVPIIMLTARVDESDRLRGLDVGADDYVTKPFSPREVVARVRAVLRRVQPQAAGGVLHRGSLTIDARKMAVARDGAPIDLTPTEFQIVAALARQPGRVFTRAQLLDAVRGTEVESFERAIDAHIKNIRRKLEVDSRRPEYLLTVYGIGYKFKES
jgi:two-component system, OmpR family, alkaline phosphatase synthesis response regulator PhoP